MATKTPRLNVTLDNKLIERVALYAESEDMSLSMAAKDLIETALDLHEDYYLSRLSEKRLKESGGRRISHEEAWD